jgi:ParB family chromosome partitioning protein
MDHTAATAQTLDLHRLELRYAELRVPDTAAITRLAQSIAVNGQLVPCIAVAGEGNAAILLDGYRRVAALRQLGKDTAEVECWDGDPVQGLLGVLARTRSRAFVPIEEALLLRELLSIGSLSQHDIARRCGRDVSWVSRRLQLVTALSDGLLTAVRQGKVSTWAAVRILGPLARANSAHAEQLLESLHTTPLTTRQLATWFAQYQGASRTVRERMVEAPQLLLNSLTAKADEKSADRLREGPEGEVLADIRILDAVSARLRRRLYALAPSPVDLPPAVTAAVSALQPALAALQCHLRKGCSDEIARDSSSRADTASARSGAARDQPAVEAVA